MSFRMPKPVIARFPSRTGWEAPMICNYMQMHACLLLGSNLPRYHLRRCTAHVPCCFSWFFDAVYILITYAWTHALQMCQESPAIKTTQTLLTWVWHLEPPQNHSFWQGADACGATPCPKDVVQNIFFLAYVCMSMYNKHTYIYIHMSVYI